VRFGPKVTTRAKTVALRLQPQRERVELLLLFLLCKKESSSFAGSSMCSNVVKCRFEFSIFGVFAGIEPTTSRQTVLHPDQQS